MTSKQLLQQDKRASSNGANMMQADTTKTQAAWCARLLLQGQIRRNRPNNRFLYTFQQGKRASSNRA